MNDILIPLAIFVATMGVCLSILLRSSRAGDRARARLLAGEDGDQEAAPFGSWGPALAGLSMIGESGRASLGAELRAAGFHGSKALETYIAARSLLIWGPALGALAMAAIEDPAAWPGVLGVGLVVMMLGFSLPRAYVRAKAKARGQQLERALPVALDLLALGLEAGQGLQAALGRVGRELRSTYPALGEELAITGRVAEVRSLGHALAGLAVRIPRGEFRNLAQILIQANRLGTDLSGALNEFATDLRSRLRQRAEAQANRLSLWMLFPTIFCLLTAAAIILIGPVVVEFRERGAASGQPAGEALGGAGGMAQGGLATPGPR